VVYLILPTTFETGIITNKYIPIFQVPFRGGSLIDLASLITSTILSGVLNPANSTIVFKFFQLLADLNIRSICAARKKPLPGPVERRISAYSVGWIKIEEENSVKKESLEFIKIGEYLCIGHAHHIIAVFFLSLYIDDIDCSTCQEGIVFTILHD
jgi:hypothetical protein